MEEETPPQAQAEEPPPSSSPKPRYRKIGVLYYTSTLLCTAGHIGYGRRLVKAQKLFGNGDFVVFKQVKSQQEDGIPWKFVRECYILKALHHPNIVSLDGTDAYIQKRKGRLAMEFLPYCLSDIIEAHSWNQRMHLPPSCLRKVIKGILSGLEHAHSHGIIHRDIKPRSIMLDEQGAPKIIGWGLGRAWTMPPRELTNPVVTLPYRAPELILGGMHEPALDIWAAGCLWYELITARSMFGTPSPTEWPELDSFPMFSPSFPRWKRGEDYRRWKALVELNLGEDGLDLLLQMLTMNPANRISAREALVHPYFHNVRVDSLERQCIREMWRNDMKWVWTDVNIPVGVRDLIQEVWREYRLEDGFPGIFVQKKR